MTALEKANELLDGDSRNIPELAVAYAQHIEWRFRGSPERIVEGTVVAYRVYAQIVLGLEEENPVYKPDDSALAWFRDRGYVVTDNVYEKMWYVLKRSLRSVICPSKDGELAVMAAIEADYIGPVSDTKKVESPNIGA